MSTRTFPSTFFSSSIFRTIILSSTITLSTELACFSSAGQSSLIVDGQEINSTFDNFEDVRRQCLNELQEETTQTMIPAMVFLLLLAVIGLIGNSLVMFVYSCKFKQSATRILIISIALFDLVANVLAIPGDIYDMFHIWDFDNPPLCKGRLFFSAFTTLSSAMALLAIAVIRYRKICTPHSWQITIGKAKLISVMLAFLGIIFSIPYAIISGRQTKRTPYHGIVGYECTTDDSFVPTIWPILNYIFYLLLYICCGLPLTVLYILVGVQAWKHSKRHGVSSPSPSTTKTTIASNTSSDINQSKPSQAESSTDGCIRNLGQSDSEESPDITSNSNRNNEDINSGEIVEHIDQYTVRIFNDRVEIRTPMMGEIVVNLQKATSGLTGIPENHDIREDEQVVNIDNIHDLNQETDCDFMTSVQSDENVGVDYRPATDCRTKIQTTIATTSHIEQRTEQPTFAANSELAAELNENSDFGPKTPTCTNPWEDMTSDKHSLGSDVSQASCNIDPVAALKWVDIVYSLEGDQATSKLNIPNTGNSFSFRISPSNNLLNKADWLRHIIVEALSKSKSGRPGEVTERNNEDNVELSFLETGNAISTDEHSRIDKPTSCVESTRPTSTRSMTNRLKEIIIKKSSILKTGLKRRQSNRQIMSRTTVMLIIVSAIYVLGFLPHLGLMFYKFTSSYEQFASMSMAGFTLYNLFVRTFFLNCAANPIIYSLCDRNFRRECFSLFSCRSRR